MSARQAKRTSARAPGVLTRRSKVGADDIRRFYARFPRRPRRVAPKGLAATATLTNIPNGIGDTVVLLEAVAAAEVAGATVHAWSASPHWEALQPFAAPIPISHPPLYCNLCDAVAAWDLGAGHVTQRARRLLGLPGTHAPGGWIQAAGVRRQQGRVSLHFEAGPHAEWQRANLHPRARKVYPSTWIALREFIAARPDLTFIEVGKTRYMLQDNVEDGTGRPLAETIRLMAECEFHIGVISGPMHLAAALGAKVIALLNFPRPSQLMLPNLRSIGVVEEEWLYPTQVVLHQEEDSPHWPRLTARTLSEAIDGGVYPYWSDKVANALHEI